jgi:hypothetical protein
MKTRTVTKSIAMATVCFAATFAGAAQYTWTGSADGNWSNAANWDASGVPSVNTNGSICGAANVITIQKGTYKPTENVPTMPNSNKLKDGTPLFVIEPGAELAISGFVKNMDVPSQNSIQAVVGAGAKLTWNVSSLIMLARNSGNKIPQTYDIQGTFNLNTATLQMGKQSGSFSLWNLNGGTVNVSGSLYGGDVTSAGGKADYTSGYSQVNLTGGSAFTVGNAMSKMEGTNTLSDPTLVFDIQDAKSTVTAKFGGNFASLEAVQAGLGTYFISSTLGPANLMAADNGNGTFTVTAKHADTQKPRAKN